VSLLEDSRSRSTKGVAEGVFKGTVQVIHGDIDVIIVGTQAAVSSAGPRDDLADFPVAVAKLVVVLARVGQATASLSNKDKLSIIACDRLEGDISQAVLSGLKGGFEGSNGAGLDNVQVLGGKLVGDTTDGGNSTGGDRLVGFMGLLGKSESTVAGMLERSRVRGLEEFAQGLFEDLVLVFHGELGDIVIVGAQAAVSSAGPRDDLAGLPVAVTKLLSALFVEAAISDTSEDSLAFTDGGRVQLQSLETVVRFAEGNVVGSDGTLGDDAHVIGSEGLSNTIDGEGGTVGGRVLVVDFDKLEGAVLDMFKVVVARVTDDGAEGVLEGMVQVVHGDFNVIIVGAQAAVSSAGPRDDLADLPVAVAKLDVVVLAGLGQATFGGSLDGDFSVGDIASLSKGEALKAEIGGLEGKLVGSDGALLDDAEIFGAEGALETVDGHNSGALHGLLVGSKTSLGEGGEGEGSGKELHDGLCRSFELAICEHNVDLDESCLENAFLPGST